MASPELLPSKVIGEDQVSEEVIKGRHPLLLLYIYAMHPQCCIYDI